MLSFLTMLFAGFNLLKVLAIGIPLLAVSHGLAYWVGTQIGKRDERVNIARAVAIETQKHTAWLQRVGAIAGALSDDDQKIELSNDDVQTRIENALTKPAPPVEPGAPPVEPGTSPVCLSPTFLRELDKLR